MKVGLEREEEGLIDLSSHGAVFCRCTSLIGAVAKW